MIIFQGLRIANRMKPGTQNLLCERFQILLQKCLTVLGAPPRQVCSAVGNTTQDTGCNTTSE